MNRRRMILASKRTWEIINGVLHIYSDTAMTDLDEYAAQPWHANSDAITAVEIHNGVTRIGNMVFGNLVNLTSVSYPDTVTSIGNKAFAGTGLTSIVLREGIITLGSGVFRNCVDLVSVTIPYSVTAIPIYLFFNSNELTTINYNGTITEWNAMVKGDYWNYNTGNYTIYCNNGQI